MRPSKIKGFNAILIIFLLLLVVNVSAETTFFDQDDAFIMSDFSPTPVSPNLDNPASSSPNGDISCAYNKNYDWACSAWSACIDGKQTKECKKYNNCGNDYGRPVTEITCENRASTTFLSNATPDNKNDNPKEALFDIIAEIVTEPKTAGENLIIKVSLINFGAPNTVDANLEYTITNSDRAIVGQYTQIIPVTTQTEFLDRISTIGLMDGQYTLNIQLTYAGQTNPASTEKTFNIGEVGLLERLFRNAGIRAFLPSAIIIISSIWILWIYIRIEKNKLKESAEELNKTDIKR